MTNQSFVLKIAFFTALCFVLSFSFSLLAGDEDKQGYPLSVIAKYKVLFEGPTYKIDQEKVWSADELGDATTLVIKAVATDIEVLQSIDNELKVLVQGKFSRSNVLQVATSGEKFVIDLSKQDKEKKDGFRISSDSGELKIFIPKNFKRIEIANVAGDIEIKLPELEAIDLKTVSGDIEVEGNIRDLKLKTVSGDMEIDLASSAVMLDIKTTSGDAEIEFAQGGLNAEIDFSSISGDLEIKSEREGIKNHYGKKFKGTQGRGEGKFQLQSISGDFEIKF